MNPASAISNAPGSNPNIIEYLPFMLNKSNPWFLSFSNVITRSYHIFALLALIQISRASLTAGAVTVTVNTSDVGPEISPKMVGLSYETSLMLPTADGVYYFRPDNQPLINIFKTIGVKSLRIGGNSVDAPTVPMPSEEDVTRSFEFAKAAGVKVIYSMRLEESSDTGALPLSSAETNAKYAARIALHIHARYADVLDCFAIGNEPDYFKDYAVYSGKWKAIHDAITAVYPEARFCGPDQNPDPVFAKKMVRAFGNDIDRLVILTQHSYAFGCSYKNPEARANIADLIPFDAGQAREEMLSPKVYETYERMHDGITEAIAGTSVAYRLTECNSYWFSGLKGASDSYTSALWSVDYLHWWGGHGAEGLNFHTGDRTGGTITLPCRYAAFVTSGNGYEARPLAYGMKLFDLGGHGRQLPVTITAGTDQNVAAYANVSHDKTLFVTVINRTHGREAEAQMVQIKLDTLPPNIEAQAIFLCGKNNDISGGSADVTLGGSPIKEDGTWDGQWTALSSSAVSKDAVVVTMPPGSAAVVKITTKSMRLKRP